MHFKIKNLEGSRGFLNQCDTWKPKYEERRSQ